VVKKKLDAEAVAPGLAVGVKTMIARQRARSARNILLFIFVSLLESKGMLSQDEQQRDESQTKKRSLNTLLRSLEPTKVNVWAELMLVSIPSQGMEIAKRAGLRVQPFEVFGEKSFG